ncbi:MAG: hypothetical protein V4665_02035 [Patescibacteria group bacterium]
MFPVYCKECWYGDQWDPRAYGHDYDFDKTFFEQYKELSSKVPRLALWQRNVVDSEFSNLIGECKNVYMSVSVVLQSEDVYYSKGVDSSRGIVSSYNVVDCDQCFENMEGEKNYNSQYLTLSRNCIDSYYLFDCVNCSHCFMCSNLRNKEFCIRNKQYTKEEYFNRLTEMHLESNLQRKILISEFDDIQVAAIHRFAHVIRSVDSTGNNLLNVKNCINCFDIHDAENGKNCYRAFLFKDNMDADYAGKSELMYEYTTGAKDDYNVKFSYSAMDNIRNAEYTESCISSSDIFGCISFKNGQYAILNKTYSKEEFISLRQKIIDQMMEMPYSDAGGRIYSYGEFFPFELSPFAYNETPAQDFVPLTKEQALRKAIPWRDFEIKFFNITVEHQNIPDDILSVDQNILNEVLGCSHEGNCNHQCATAFRITPFELQFYKKNKIPLPTECANCRFYARFNKTLPLKLWHRSCMCDLSNHSHEEICPNEFETPYSPDRLEKVYCESCYQKEVL